MAELRMHGHVYGNFRDRDYKHKRGKNSKWRDERPGMSDEHLRNIRKLPCCVCARAPNSEAHHLMSVGERGLSVKATDKWSVPLCQAHHDDVEKNGRGQREKGWFKAFGIDVVHLAESLWRSRDDLDRMRRIARAHYEGGGLRGATNTSLAERAK